MRCLCRRGWFARPAKTPDGTAMTRLLLLVIRGYQRFISPYTPPRCRFYPSCSAYAVTALARYGAWRGAGLAVRRLLRCHPWHPGGYDPVP